MNDLYEISLLLDFYGQMVTKRQYEILDLYYSNDYSLGEIAHELDISRQGVYDNIRRGKAALYSMEEKLGLVRRFTELKENSSAILECLNDIEVNNLTIKDKENIITAKEIARSILED